MVLRNVDKFGLVNESFVGLVEREDRDGKTRVVLMYFQSFEFVFYLRLMLTILTITNTLPIALQRKDQDIVNVVNYVRFTRSLLDKVRREEWAC